MRAGEEKSNVSRASLKITCLPISRNIKVMHFREGRARSVFPIERKFMKLFTSDSFLISQVNNNISLDDVAGCVNGSRSIKFDGEASQVRHLFVADTPVT